MTAVLDNLVAVRRTAMDLLARREHGRVELTRKLRQRGACPHRTAEGQSSICRAAIGIDGQRMGFSRFGMYMLLFHCRHTGGTLQGHPLETSGVGWFAESALPEPTAGAQWWGAMAFAAIRGEMSGASFDAPRESVWRQPEGFDL